MAHYYLETESGRNGDSAWPLWGLAMSLVVAVSRCFLNSQPNFTPSPDLSHPYCNASLSPPSLPFSLSLTLLRLRLQFALKLLLGHLEFKT